MAHHSLSLAPAGGGGGRRVGACSPHPLKTFFSLYGGGGSSLCGGVGIFSPYRGLFLYVGEHIFFSCWAIFRLAPHPLRSFLRTPIVTEHKILHTVHCINLLLYTVQYTVHNILYTLYKVHTLVHCTVLSVHPSLLACRCVYILQVYIIYSLIIGGLDRLIPINYIRRQT